MILKKKNIFHTLLRKTKPISRTSIILNKSTKKKNISSINISLRNHNIRNSHKRPILITSIKKVNRNRINLNKIKKKPVVNKPPVHHIKVNKISPPSSLQLSKKEITPAPVIIPPKKQSIKYAILIGINYNGTPYQLNGCINDVKDMKSLLNSKYNYSQNCILTLTDETIIKPTRNNILNIFKRILDIARIRNHTIDTLCFVYSGHGTWSTDMNGDETDKRDERIVSSDMKTISDDELNQQFKIFPSSTKIITLFDSCHSGTMMDCTFSYNKVNNNYIRETNNRSNSNYPNWYSLSACKDTQTSQEGQVGGGGKYNGYFIRSLLNSLKEVNYSTNYDRLMNNVQQKINQLNGTQKIVLSSNIEFNLNNSFSL
jgi:hypothetical protein